MVHFQFSHVLFQHLVLPLLDNPLFNELLDFLKRGVPSLFNSCELYYVVPQLCLNGLTDLPCLGELEGNSLVLGQKTSLAVVTDSPTRCLRVRVNRIGSG
ncbi:MAG: hypothetical protein H6Q55_2357, partial [Deltaproteobacteria bacterium]|nr:hypothetical protein [Deltaproteobacteria bacterium]